jgi:hypothetical protein
MDTRQQHGNREAPLVLGVLLVVAGAAAFAMQQAGIRIGDLVGDAGWPFFVIVPGLVLLLSALLITPPRGLGFAIAGSIVTTVGLILLYQSSTGTWESWAYVWALIPGAAGVAMVVYGGIAGEGSLMAAGTRVATVSTVLFIVGLWFFGPVFSVFMIVSFAKPLWESHRPAARPLGFSAAESD